MNLITALIIILVICAALFGIWHVLRPPTLNPTMHAILGAILILVGIAVAIYFFKGSDRRVGSHQNQEYQSNPRSFPAYRSAIPIARGRTASRSITCTPDHFSLSRRPYLFRFGSKRGQQQS